MLEHHVDVVALAGEVPDGLAELAGPFSQSLYSGVPTAGIWPQQLNFLRLMTPLAPSCMTKSALSSSEMTPMALAPVVAMSWIAIEPRPPEAPHTSTFWPALSTCGRWPNSMR